MLFPWLFIACLVGVYHHKVHLTLLSEAKHTSIRTTETNDTPQTSIRSSDSATPGIFLVFPEMWLCAHCFFMSFLDTIQKIMIKTVCLSTKRNIHWCKIQTEMSKDNSIVAVVGEYCVSDLFSLQIQDQKAECGMSTSTGQKNYFWKIKMTVEAGISLASYWNQSWRN